METIGMQSRYSRNLAFCCKLIFNINSEFMNYCKNDVLSLDTFRLLQLLKRPDTWREVLLVNFSCKPQPQHVQKYGGLTRFCCLIWVVRLATNAMLKKIPNLPGMCGANGCFGSLDDAGVKFWQRRIYKNPKLCEHELVRGNITRTFHSEQLFIHFGTALKKDHYVSLFSVILGFGSSCYFRHAIFTCGPLVAPECR